MVFGGNQKREKGYRGLSQAVTHCLLMECGKHAKVSPRVLFWVDPNVPESIKKRFLRGETL